MGPIQLRFSTLVKKTQTEVVILLPYFCWTAIENKLIKVHSVECHRRIAMSDHDSNKANQKNNRRDFLKAGGLSLATAFMTTKLFSTHANAQGAKPAAKPAAGGASGLTMVKESEPLAISLHYKENVKDVDTKKFPKRAGAEGAKQFCWNCQFYQHQPKAEASKSKAAVCTLFAGKGVVAGGWCNSWVLDPSAK
jgi:hypothetical protein